MNIDKIITYNDILKPYFENLPNMLKIDEGLGEIAKPVLLPEFTGKDVWVLYIYCSTCKQEQPILFEYSENIKVLKKLQIAIVRQMIYFQDNYCKCEKHNEK